MLPNCDVREDSWESLGLKGDQTSQSQRKSTMNIHWKDWGWRWSFNILATWCEQPTHWKRPWCWERMKAKGEGNRGWDGWMASPIQWTWTWANWEMVSNREVWHAAVHEVSKSQIRLSDWTATATTMVSHMQVPTWQGKEHTLIEEKESCEGYSKPSSWLFTGRVLVQKETFFFFLLGSAIIVRWVLLLQLST